MKAVQVGHNSLKTTALPTRNFRDTVPSALVTLEHLESTCGNTSPTKLGWKLTSL